MPGVLRESHLSESQSSPLSSKNNTSPNRVQLNKIIRVKPLAECSREDSMDGTYYS